MGYSLHKEDPWVGSQARLRIALQSQNGLKHLKHEV